MTPQGTNAQHFESVHLLRGVAAMLVLICHSFRSDYFWGDEGEWRMAERPVVADQRTKGQPSLRDGLHCNQLTDGG